MRARRRTPLLLLLAALWAQPAFGHGAPPVSQFIVKRGPQLLVPTLYWGVFLGSDGGPWRWICEDAINKDQQRRWALCGNGTYHVTDYAGITSSRDGGCTWVAATGEIATRATSGLLPDPVDGKRAWATTNQGMDAPWNGLFVTTDDGLGWTPVLTGDEYFRGPAISRDGQALYVIGVARTGSPPAVTLHTSRDGGKRFTAVVLSGSPPTDVEPLAVDPSDAATVYLVYRYGAEQALVRAASQGAQLSEAFRLPAVIGGVAFDEARKAVLVPVTPLGDNVLQGGLMRSVNGGPFAPFSDLTRAQCVFPDGDVIYACSSSFAPDRKAIARSDDGGAHFTKVFNYDETVGPSLDCPANTPVAMICPGIWDTYGSQLGVNLGRPDAALPVDAGSTTPPDAGCACGVGHPARAPVGVVVVALALVPGLARRRRRRPQRAGGSSAIPSG